MNANSRLMLVDDFHHREWRTNPAEARVANPVVRLCPNFSYKVPLKIHTANSCPQFKDSGKLGLPPLPLNRLIEIPLNRRLANGYLIEASLNRLLANSYQ